ncbi:MAG: type II methionyl aminopeptidase [Nitrososphaerales archaeon]|nr:type II methionyl aminopeptidase [Nitrososphaerales archaeon]
MSIPEQYHRSGKITREVRDLVKERVEPGTGYVEACEMVEREIVARGGAPAFPTGIGVNHVTAHYAPQEDNPAKFTESDLIKVDFGVHVDGYVTDTAVTLTFNPEYELLIEATERALSAAVEVLKKERRVGEVGREVFREASRFGFKTIENLTGHTLDRFVVHAGKSIPNLYMPNMPSLKDGEVFAVEPFLTLGSAAGYVVDAPSVTIFSLTARKSTGARELDEFVAAVWNERKTLPFTPRWYRATKGKGEPEKLIKEMVRRKVGRAYPTLVEASKKPVAQFEHTMAFEGGGLVILT